MSTTLKPLFVNSSQGAMSLNRYSRGKGKAQGLQLTRTHVSPHHGEVAGLGFITISRDEAMELASALFAFAHCAEVPE